MAKNFLKLMENNNLHSKKHKSLKQENRNKSTSQHRVWGNQKAIDKAKKKTKTNIKQTDKK